MAQPVQPPKVTVYTEQEKDNRRKAIDLTVETLKLYISFSTLAIAGLLGVFNSSDNSDVVFSLWFSVLCFFLCALLSILIINVFIAEVCDGIWNVRSRHVLWFNRIAICLFFVALFFAIQYIIYNGKQKTAKFVSRSTSSDTTKVLILNDTLKTFTLNKDSSIINNCTCINRNHCRPNCFKRKRGH